MEGNQKKCFYQRCKNNEKPKKLKMVHLHYHIQKCFVEYALQLDAQNKKTETFDVSFFPHLFACATENNTTDK